MPNSCAAVEPRALGASPQGGPGRRAASLRPRLPDDGTSTAYVSPHRERRPPPHSEGARPSFARRLDKPVDQLLRAAVSSTEYDEIRLGLDYAELALENGEGEEAERHSRDALTRAELASLEQFQSRGHYLLGRAYEVLGRLDDAVRELEHAVASDSTVLAVRAGHRADPLPSQPGRREPGHRGRRAHPGHAAGARARPDRRGRPARHDGRQRIHRSWRPQPGGAPVRGRHSPHRGVGLSRRPELGLLERECGLLRTRRDPGRRGAGHAGAGTAGRGQRHPQPRAAAALARSPRAAHGSGISAGSARTPQPRARRAQVVQRRSHRHCQSGMALADAHLRSGDAEHAVDLAAEVEAMDEPARCPSARRLR